MADNLMEQRLAIPYIKLKFSLVFPDGAQLMPEKVSALRGGMGEMLLRQNCVGGRDCRSCEFSDACIVYRVLYTPMKKQPDYVRDVNSIGYLIECESRQKEFQPGEGFFFFLTLFGGNIANFSQYLQAFHQFGMFGMGKNRNRYQIAEVRNSRGQIIMSDFQVYLENYVTEHVSDYVRRRLIELEKKGCSGEIIFHTPLCLKYKGNYLREFCMEAILPAVFRRVQMLDYYMEKYIDQPILQEIPAIADQSVSMHTVPRYSSRKQKKIFLKGIAGRVELESIPDDVMPYILAGELLHIGKNTSFGFGRYTIQ